MGADGGSIPKRVDLVKSKQKAESVDKHRQRIAKWRLCALSRRPLEQPIVACKLGKLYNKDVIYEWLLDNSSYGDGDVVCPHIKSTKDVVTLQLSPNPHYGGEDGNEEQDAPFMCPVTMREMNGLTQFIFIWKCGHVFSEQALKEIPSNECIQCGTEFEESDVYRIHPSVEEQARMMAKLLKKRKGKRKNGKNGEDIDDSKRRRVAGANGGAEGGSAATTTDEVSEEAEKKFEAAIPRIIKAKETSAAIKSLYSSHKGSSKSTDGNWLTKGTFNRYSQM